ncbi:MAG: mechanosensitive ion channel family protein [Spirochaetaceae bacterium]|jgi:miniconductance mechanosensitive channel|nr:mechanosensitive ion channel family protein [Spirochaetaceae bacterium]
MPNIIDDFLLPLWLSLGLAEPWIGRFNNGVSLVIFIGAILIIAGLSATALRALIHHIVKNTKTTWDDRLEEAHFFLRLSRLIPALSAYLLIPLFLLIDAGTTVFIRRLVIAYIAVVSAHIGAAFLDGIHLIYLHEAEEIAKRRPIKGYIQLIKVFLYLIGGILGVTVIINVSPLGVLSGVGAMSAVLLLIFKDSILGFVSSMQLSSNDMIRIGDWIEMANYNADGFVIDVNLHSVKVRNWDNTITSIPIYALISGSFKNWRGMSESDGRRIKRSLHIDMRSVRFLTQEEIETLSKIPLLAEYMQTKREEIAEHNRRLNIPENDFVSGRRLTNLGTYRAYSELYVRNLPHTAKNLTNMVRYLQPDENGIQMELYLFCADKVWVNYERIQADILDHLLAIMPQFGLRVFQNPSGSDLQLIAENLQRIADRKSPV